MIHSIHPSHRILCIDMKSFYASCEAVLRGLDPLTVKLVVVGDINRNGSVVLASSPVMKKQHQIKTGNRLFEVKKINDPEIIIAQARMDSYIQISERIRKIFLDFVPPTALHVYSVDESWLTLDGTENLWGNSWNAAQLIIDRIKEETGCIATVGIGENKFQAKICLDIFGKDESIFECTYENFPSLFHHHKVKEMWGIGAATEKRLNSLGIFTIGDLANAETDLLKNEFGVNGIKLNEYANGIDDSPVLYSADKPPSAAFGFGSGNSLNKDSKSIGRGVTLLRDYHKRDEIIGVISELTEEVCALLRKRHFVGRTFHLTIGYSHTAAKKGFSRQYSFKKESFNDPLEFKEVYLKLFHDYDDGKSPVRTIKVSIGKLSEEAEQPAEIPNDKRKNLLNSLDRLNERFGNGKVRNASSYSASSVSKTRINKTAGHFK